MKCQAPISVKNKKKYLRMWSAEITFSMQRVGYNSTSVDWSHTVQMYNVYSFG